MMIKSPAWGVLTDAALICLAVGLFLFTAYHFSTDLPLVSTDPNAGSASKNISVNTAVGERPPARKPWQYIIIHHSATTAGSSSRFDQYQRDRWGWEGLAYHFVIGNGRGSGDGAIEIGERWKKGVPGPHTRNGEFNARSVAVCLVGDFNTRPPTQRQIASLRELIKRLQERFAIPDNRVIVHGDVPNSFTQCPGKYLTTTWVREMLAARPLTERMARAETREKRLR